MSHTPLFVLLAAAALSGCAAIPAASTAPALSAFGLTVGERFAPAMVAKVVGENEHRYRDRDKVEHKGTIYKIEPRLPQEAYNSYSVATTEGGVIYSITGVHADPAHAARCDVSRRLEAELEQKYGKPTREASSGVLSYGEVTGKEFRGVYFVAPQCSSGRYSIIYTDDAVKTAAPAGR